MNTVQHAGKVYRLSGGSVEVRIVRPPGVMREGFTQWRTLRDDGPTAKAVRAKLRPT